jgi:hypothetical protein
MGPLDHGVSECFGKENKGKIGECSFCYTASIENPDEIPPLEPISPAPVRHHNHPPSQLAIAGEEALKYCIGSTLAQIELVLCFRNRREPLFKILSPILYAMDDL